MQKCYRKKTSCESSPSFSSINVIHYCLQPLLQKFTDTIISHVGTNNFVNKSFHVVLENILNTKTFIKNSPPHCKATFPMLSMEMMTLKASLRAKNLSSYLNSLKIDIVDNSNIRKEYPDKKGCTSPKESLVTLP